MREVERVILPDEMLDDPFRAVAEATEEPGLNALLAADPLRGFQGHERRSLAEFLDILA